jgi:hypothetical protein
MLFIIENRCSAEVDVPGKPKINSVTFTRLTTEIFFSQKIFKKFN